jgi:hypothetical protein
MKERNIALWFSVLFGFFGGRVIHERCTWIDVVACLVLVLLGIALYWIASRKTAHE